VVPWSDRSILRLSDLIALALLLLVQWRVTVILFPPARWPFRGRAFAAARAAIAAFDTLVLLGFLLGIYKIMDLPRAASLMAGTVVLAYSVAAASVLAVSFVVRRIGHRLERGMDPGRRRVLHAAGNLLIASPVAVLAAGFVTRTDFHVREIDVPLAGLPASLDGLRILHLSDIHLSAFLSEHQFARVIDASNGLRANLAVVTGDLISHVGDPLDACIRQLARLKAEAGVFGCMGNHERYAGGEAQVRTAAARSGIRFLRGEAHSLRFGAATLNLAGVDYQRKGDQARYLHDADRLVAPGAVNVLLSHNPDVFPVAARQGFDLLLAGHTHGGQVTVEILEQALNPARFFTPYVHGLYRLGHAAAYVTRGIGTICIPARIGALPEITVVRLRKG